MRRPRLRLLDGGFEKWSREGRPVSVQAVSYPMTTFNAQPVETIYCSFSHAKASHGRPETVFWDTRSLAEFHGAGEGHGKPPPRPGHIQGAVHLDWLELIDPETKTFKPAAELRALLESKGITPKREVNTYCGGGRRGSIGTIVLKILGYQNARSYAAGFSRCRWSRQSDTPVESLG
jgi:thiosulfate/3-mercaptopyruvate sulfurtransferase